MDESEVLEILQKVGAFRAGHFVFVSGLHADTYVNKDALYAYTHEISRLCKTIAERFAQSGVEAVSGPAVGGAILSQWTAYHLTDILGKEIPGVYADKDGQGGFVIKRGYDAVIKGKKVLDVEDLTTTGGSVAKVVEAARKAGAQVIAAIAICNRGDVTKEAAGNPPRFESLVTVHLEQWPESECELCAKGIPVNVEVGHGREFLAKKQSR